MNRGVSYVEAATARGFSRTLILGIVNGVKSTATPAESTADYIRRERSMSDFCG